MAVGVALACAGTRVVAATAPVALPRVDGISTGPVVLLFAAGLSVLVGIMFGLISVLKFAVSRLSSLNDGGRSVSEGRERHRARNVLLLGLMGIYGMIAYEAARGRARWVSASLLACSHAT